jgi:type I restriction enzyme S subunit
MTKGWQTKTLGDLCSFENGDRGENYPSKSVQTTSGVPFINAGHLAEFGIDFTNMNYIPRERFDLLGNGKIRRDDILFCLRGSLGKFGSVGDLNEGAIASSLVIIRPSNAILHEFVLAYFQSDLCAEMIRKFKNGTAQPNLGAASLKKFIIPVPPVAEQQRIVGILSEAFEGIASAKANVKKNLQNAHAIFESQLQTVLTQRGVGWVDRTLDQVCTVERGSSPRPINEYFTNKPDGVNWIKIGDTEEGGKYVYSTAQKITPEGAKQSRFVKEGDFILTNSMSFGRPYIMKTSGYIHDGWFVLRLNVAIDTDYFYYLLSSSIIQSQFASLASGSVVKNISGDLVKKAVLPIPPLEQQHVIVKKLLEFSEETQRLAMIYERKLTALEAFKKLLLHQAFTGQL